LKYDDKSISASQPSTSFSSTNADVQIMYDAELYCHSLSHTSAHILKSVICFLI